MIEINLLPKDYRKGSGSFSLGKAGVYVVAGALGMVVLLAGITFYQMHQLSQLENNIEKANQRAEMLRQDIRVVDALMDVKSKIQRRMTAVERLDRHRSTWVRIMADFARNVPEFVWLGEFKEIEPPKPKADATKDAKTKNAANEEKSPQIASDLLPPTQPVEIRGYSFTLNALAAFMIKMMRSDYFDEVELVDSRDTTFAQADSKAYTFMVTANVHHLSEEDLQNMIAQADESDSESTHRSLN
jgi:Tfp pilus assembly protein PilN